MTEISAGHELEYDAESDEYWCDECDRAFGGTPDHEAFLAARTPEQQARDMLERIGVENAQNFSSGNLVELANLIAQSRIGGRYNSILRRHWPEIFAARSPAPSDEPADGFRNMLDVIRHHIRVQDVKALGRDAQWIDEVFAENPAAPSVEARDAEPWLLLEAAAELEYAATHAPWRPTTQVVSNVLGIARRLRESAARASLLPPEKT